MLSKNDDVTLHITDLGENGEGIGRAEGLALFVPGALPGETVSAKIVKLKKNLGYGKLLSVIKPAPNRVTPPCLVFGRCGGCALQHLSYPAQLAAKEKAVREKLARIGGFAEAPVLPIIGMEDPLHYRNKGQFPAGMSSGCAVFGFYSRRSHDIVPVPADGCLIQHPAAQAVITRVTAFLNSRAIPVYDEKTHKGVVRHLLVKTGFASGQVMACLVVNANGIQNEDAFVSCLADVPGITSVCLNVNKQKDNVILGRKTRVLWGSPTISDNIGPFSFAISPTSFYQVNPAQTKVLYETAVQMAGFQKTDTVIDAYCGIGTISLFAASHVKQVYGFELNEAAVADAALNAARNHIENAVFETGDAAELLKRCAETKRVVPDVLILDPPRKGCGPELLDTIPILNPGRVVYVSCDAATLARDLRHLAALGYRLEKVRPVDCFPMTCHVECVAFMSRTG